MKIKIVILSVIFTIAIFGFYNSVFAQCAGTAGDCDEYCHNAAGGPCHLDSESGLYVGINPPDNTFCLCNPLSSDTLEDLVASVTNFIFYVATVIFPIMVAIAAFLFMTAAGNPSKVEQAKNILIYSSVGYGIVILANVLVYVIKDVIGG